MSLSEQGGGVAGRQPLPRPLARRMQQAQRALLRAPPPLVFAAAVAVSALLWLADRATGQKVSLSVVSLLPVGFVAWFLGFRRAALLAFAVAGAWGALDHGVHPERPLPLVVVNAGIHLGYALLTSLLLDAVHVAYQRERTLARTDALTGLANRRSVMAILRRVAEQCARDGQPLTIAYLDADHFKQVNDRIGHDAGDEVLRVSAERMRAAVREGELAGRLGGDEFVVLLPGVPADAARPRLEALERDLASALSARGWPVTYSIGAVTYAVPPSDPWEAVHRADEVGREVKRAGKAHVRVVTEG